MVEECLKSEAILPIQFFKYVGDNDGLLELWGNLEGRRFCLCRDTYGYIPAGAHSHSSPEKELAKIIK